MSPVPPLEPDTAPHAVHTQLDQFDAAFGTLPSLFNAVVNPPAALASMWCSFAGFGGGALGPELAEPIAVAVDFSQIPLPDEGQS